MHQTLNRDMTPDGARSNAMHLPLIIRNQPLFLEDIIPQMSSLLLNRGQRLRRPLGTKHGLADAMDPPCHPLGPAATVRPPGKLEAGHQIVARFRVHFHRFL